jgi:hypothetical protein
VVWVNNLQLRYFRVGARLHWDLRRGRDPESWGGASSAGGSIRLLDEWFYFDEPEPRLGAAQWMRYLPPLARGTGIYQYQLGSSEEKR